MIKIRQETKKDYEKIYIMVKESFKTAEHTDGTEQDLVTKLRNSNSYIPELSLVAELNGEIVGYIMFTKIKIGNSTQIALAPLAVSPKYQRQQIGTKLINKGHEEAKKLGYNFSVVLGSSKYYPRLGYKPAIKYGIKAPFEVESENFMAIKLNDTNEGIKGVVMYPKEFGI